MEALVKSLVAVVRSVGFSDMEVLLKEVNNFLNSQFSLNSSFRAEVKKDHILVYREFVDSSGYFEHKVVAHFSPSNH
jgi:hypothetical protein